jgi:hypothetical protein
VVALAAVVAVAGLAACSGGDGAQPPATTTLEQGERRVARAWSDDARTAYEPLDVAALQLPTRTRAWLAGERTAEEFTADLAIAIGEVELVADRVAALRAFPPDARVAPLYRWSAQLYVEYVHLLQAALAAPDPALRGQLELAARRVRVLADRIFDRGQARVEPFLHEKPNPDVVINLPPEVPDWVVEGLAAGPPLDDPPPPRSDTPALREEHRPTQPRAAWAAAVGAAGAPATDELAAAIEAGDSVRLRDLGRRFDTVARALAAVADPEGRHGREDAAQLRLALLVDAEAARAAQAGQPDVARQLADIAGAVYEAAFSG